MCVVQGGDFVRRDGTYSLESQFYFISFAVVIRSL